MVGMVFAKGGSVMFAGSSDGGRTFSSARVVSHAPVLAAGRHRGPKVLFAGQEIVVSAIVGNTAASGEHAHGLPSDGDLVVWRSRDRGKTWSKPVVVNDVPGAAREGLQAITSDGHGHLAAAWLDLRGQGTKLYGAFSQDDGAAWSKNVLIYEAAGGTICQCCAPSLAATGVGRFVVMFRNVVGESRDMYTIPLLEGRVVGPAKKMGAGTWVINGCPMDGGGLVYSHGHLMSAWRRDGDVYLSTDDRPEVKLGAGTDIAVADVGGSAAVAWSKAGRVSLWRAGKTEMLTDGVGGFPAIVGLAGGGVVAAWEADGTISTRRLP